MIVPFEPGGGSDYPAPPVILGLILGGLMEQALVRTSSLGGGDFSVLLERPIALFLFALAALVILGPFVIALVARARRRDQTPTA